MHFYNKPSTNIWLGIMFIIFPMFIGVIYFTTFLPNMYVFDGSIIPFIAMFIFLLVLGSMLVMGILFLRKGLIAKKVKAGGRKGTCVVERFETIYNRYGQRILMYVSFKGDDAKSTSRPTSSTLCFLLASNKALRWSAKSLEAIAMSMVTIQRSLMTLSWTKTIGNSKISPSIIGDC